MLKVGQKLNYVRKIMKYDINKPLTKGVKRTLEAFTTKMFELLSKEPFEQISIMQLCDETQYPRATFYNYFEDKYDLLNFCWLILAKKIKIDEYHHVNENEMFYVYFDRIYDFTRENETIIRKVLQQNNEMGYMFSSFRNFLNNQMRLIFKDCPEASKKDIPTELLADQYSNTLFLVWQWITIKENNCSKEKAHKYLHYLINDQ